VYSIVAGIEKPHASAQKLNPEITQASPITKWLDQVLPPALLGSIGRN